MNTTELRRIIESLNRLSDLVVSEIERSSVGFEQLVTEYLSLRRTLSASFKALAEEDLAADADPLDPVRRQITQRMRELFGGRLPDRLLQLHGYRGVHGLLFGYLVRHVGEPVPGARLRVITADQIHTERRIRELRDLGFEITSTRVADDDRYVLGSRLPDIDAAARTLVQRNISGERSLSAEAKDDLLDTVADTP